MNLVVDANIIFSVLIVRGKTEDIFFSEDFNLYVPEFIFIELDKYKEFILEKTSRTTIEYYKIIDIIRSKVTIITNEDVIEYIEQARDISPDPNDVIYFALALKLKCPIWSNDKKLKEQSQIKIYSTYDLINDTF